MKRMTQDDRLSVMEAEMVDRAIPGDCFDTLLVLQDEEEGGRTLVLGMVRNQPTLISSVATGLQFQQNRAAGVKMEGRTGSFGTWVSAADGERCFRVEAMPRYPAEGEVVVTVLPPQAATALPAGAGQQQ